MPFIRIKPDWNVKIARDIVINNSTNIRIKPDWNVKDLKAHKHVIRQTN